MEERETMATFKRSMVAGVLVLGLAGNARAQVSPAEAEQIHLRQQIATMEAVLQQAIRHGADLVYAQFRAVFPDPPRLGQARISGFKLPNYGVVFNVDVPMIQLPLLWEVFLREQEYRNAMAQLQGMRKQWSSMSPGRDRDQLLDRINRAEQQLGLGTVGDGDRATSLNAVPAVPAGITGTSRIPGQKDPADPEVVYSYEVKEALIDAMLTNSQALNVGPEEWLTVMAMAREANGAAPGASIDSTKGIIRVKGSVLAAYRAGTITKEEARKQVEIQEQ